MANDKNFHLLKHSSKYSKHQEYVEKFSHRWTLQIGFRQNIKRIKSLLKVLFHSHKVFNAIIKILPRFNAKDNYIPVLYHNEQALYESLRIFQVFPIKFRYYEYKPEKYYLNINLRWMLYLYKIQRQYQQTCDHYVRRKE